MINDSINRFLGVLCYPFISMEEFRQNLVGQYIRDVRKGRKEELRNQSRQDAQKTKKKLESQLIAYIRRSYNIYSYDEIYLYLEKCYLYEVRNSEKYGDELELYRDIMKKMACSLISHRDGKIVFKYWKNKEDEALFGGFAGSNKVTLFHSLNSHIPLDVIAIVYMLENQKKTQEADIRCLDHFYGNIEVADQQLSRVLEEGVAENHLHKGVSRTFPSIWDSLMEPLTAEKARYFQRMKFVDGTGEENLKMLFYLLCCGIVRGYLVLEMSNRVMPGKELPESFGDRKGDSVSAADSFGEDGNLQEIRELMECFQSGEQLDQYYKKHFQEKAEQKDERAKAVTACFVKLWDTLGKYLPAGIFQGKMCTETLGEDPEINTLDENVFLYYALREFWKDAGEDQEGEALKARKKCILQYLRVRNYLFHVSVQQKTVKGLDYFQKDHYKLNSGCVSRRP